uniref:Uncharacterized protein n=1 Tax=Agrobacterium tumefaciens TaxID=358 RepID=K7XK44_AGRTU|nr:Hypothetical protein [Agrobacterium radiobacter]
MWIYVDMLHLSTRCCEIFKISAPKLRRAIERCHPQKR